LQEYTALFPGRVNPACQKCLSEYLTRYKQHYNAMANTCAYRLHAKYENIPLEFGSAILVNNANITDAYAQKLLDRPDGKRFFAQMPVPEPTLTQKVKAVKQAVKKAAQAKKKESPATHPPDGEISSNIPPQAPQP
jgi:hypothetical protein